MEGTMKMTVAVINLLFLKSTQKIKIYKIKIRFLLKKLITLN